MARPERYWATGLVATTAEPPSPDDRGTRYARAERPDYRPLPAGLDIPALVLAGTADPWSTNAVTQRSSLH